MTTDPSVRCSHFVATCQHGSHDCESLNYCANRWDRPGDVEPFSDINLGDHDRLINQRTLNSSCQNLPMATISLIWLTTQATKPSGYEVAIGCEF